MVIYKAIKYRLTDFHARASKYDEACRSYPCHQAQWQCIPLLGLGATSQTRRERGASCASLDRSHPHRHPGRPRWLYCDRCCVMLCYDMLCYVMLCYVILCYVISCHINSHNLTYYLSYHMEMRRRMTK